MSSTPRRALALTVGLTGAVLSLAACGGSGSSAASSATAAASSALSSTAASSGSTSAPGGSGTATGSSTGATGASSTGKTYSTAVVADHDNQSSCWAIIDGSVYDLTPWINQHPGGPDKILGLCGKDATQQFQAQHGDDKEPKERLATFKIGTLKD